LGRHEPSLRTCPAGHSPPEADALVSYVTEFRDRAGAAAAWELLEDESGSATARDLPELAGLGDDSEVTADSGETVDGNPYHLLDLTIRRGPLHLGATVVDWGGGEPSLDLVRALGERLLERAEQVDAHPLDRLGSRALRLGGPGTTPILEGYTMQDGVPFPIAGEPPPEVTAGSDEPSDRFAGQVHVQRPDGDAWLLVDLERHVKQEAAEAAFEKARQQLETGSMQDLEIRECPAVAPGAYAYTAAGDASGWRYAVVRLRVGTTLAAVQFLTPSVVDALDGVLALAEAQALCLVEGCAEPVGVPEELTR
jgi:hypothetical protein